MTHAHRVILGELRTGALEGLDLMNGIWPVRALTLEAAAVLGWLADATSLTLVYRLCAFLPAIGCLAFWLPDLERRQN